MKAFAVTRALDADHPECFEELTLAVPEPRPHDILVKVKAVSVNPVDTKVRRRKSESAEPQILGWDAAGIVEAIGSEVSLFQPGEQVYYAGDLTRAGSNAEYQLVDERIVAHKPKSLSFAEAAALPLTALTAWESFFDRLDITEGESGKSLLILGGAGGVGSIGIQLAKNLTKLKIIASASREESAAWCRQLGADAIVNHRGDWAAELKTLGFDTVDYIACFNNTDEHWDRMSAAITPQGAICAIVDNVEPIRLNTLKSKSAKFAWEFMFTRSMFKTDDMIEQHDILAHVAELVDAEKIVTTLNEPPVELTCANLAAAHAKLESGSMVGKLVLTLD